MKVKFDAHIPTGSAPRDRILSRIGLGLGRESETAEAVSEIIRSNPDARFMIDTDALAAASAGALIVGTAGDLAFLKYGCGLLATDVVERIPDAMRRQPYGAGAQGCGLHPDQGHSWERLGVIDRKDGVTLPKNPVIFKFSSPCLSY